MHHIHIVGVVIGTRGLHGLGDVNLLTLSVEDQPAVLLGDRLPGRHGDIHLVALVILGQVLISGCPDDGELPEELPVRGHVHCPGGDGQRHHHGSGNGRAPQDPGHPLSVLHLLHFLKNLLFGLVGGTEMGKGLLVQSLVDHDSASCKISFSFPLARMSQVCTVDGLAPMAAAISCTEQSS